LLQRVRAGDVAPLEELEPSTSRPETDRKKLLHAYAEGLLGYTRHCSGAAQPRRAARPRRCVMCGWIWAANERMPLSTLQSTTLADQPISLTASAKDLRSAATGDHRPTSLPAQPQPGPQPWHPHGPYRPGQAHNRTNRSRGRV